MRHPRTARDARAAAAAVLVASAWLSVAGRLSVWFDLHTVGFGGGGFVAPSDARAAVLAAACIAIGALAIVTAARPSPQIRVALAIAALALSVVGLAEWWSEATVDADLPAGTVRDTPVRVLVSPTIAGWLVLTALVALQAAALSLLPRRRPILIAITVLTAATAVIGVLAPDGLTEPHDPVTIIR